MIIDKTTIDIIPDGAGALVHMHQPAGGIQVWMPRQELLRLSDALRRAAETPHTTEKET
jgi:hypothetical protein